MATEIINIDDHYGDAVDRLPEQYRNPPKQYIIPPSTYYSFVFETTNILSTPFRVDLTLYALNPDDETVLTIYSVNDSSSVLFAAELTESLGTAGGQLGIVDLSGVKWVFTSKGSIPVINTIDLGGTRSTIQVTFNTATTTVTKDGVLTTLPLAGPQFPPYYYTHASTYAANNPLGIARAGEIAVSGWESLLHAFTLNSQTMEDIMQSMLDERGLNTSEGVNLARIGQIVGEPRLGRTDADYLEAIISKIAENYSDGAEANIMATVKGLTEADSYLFTEMYDAKFRVDIVNPTLPIGTRVLTGLNNAKVAGVDYQFLYAQTDYFSFDSDPSIDTGYAVIGPDAYSYTFTPDTIDYVSRIFVDSGTTPYTLKSNSVSEDYNLGYLNANEFAGQTFIAEGKPIASIRTTSFAANSATGTLTGLIYETQNTGVPVGGPIFISTNTIDVTASGPMSQGLGFDGTPSNEIVFLFDDVIPTTGFEYAFVAARASGSGSILANCEFSATADPDGTAVKYLSGSWTADTGKDIKYQIVYATSDTAMSFIMRDDTDASTFLTELQDVLGTTGGKLLITEDNGLHDWVIESPSSLTVTSTALPSIGSGYDAVQIDILLQTDPETTRAIITKDGWLRSPSDMVYKFNDYTSYIDAFDTYNPNGLLKSAATVLRDTRAGHYSTLLTGE